MQTLLGGYLLRLTCSSVIWLKLALALAFRSSILVGTSPPKLGATSDGIPEGGLVIMVIGSSSAPPCAVCSPVFVNHFCSFVFPTEEIKCVRAGVMCYSGDVRSFLKRAHSLKHFVLKLRTKMMYKDLLKNSSLPGMRRKPS